MELILWRHAEAEDDTGAGDGARRLTRKGREQAAIVAEWIDARLEEGEWRILVSPAQRTLETVAPLEREFQVSEAIGTGTDAAALLRATGWPNAKHNVLVVGHQPTLGEVAAHLLGSPGESLSVRKGAAWWFIARDRGDGIEVQLRAVVDASTLQG